MIDTSEKCGREGRGIAQYLGPRGCVDSDAVKKWLKPVRDSMTKTAAIGLSIDLRAELQRLHEESERMHAILPGTR
jgi:hypothetical protein